MIFNNPFQVVAALDGNTLKVFLVLLFAMRAGMGAMGEKRIQGLADLSQNTVRRGLEKLKLYELAQYNGKSSGWVLASGAQQLPLLGLMLGSGEESKIDSSAGTTTINLTRKDEAVEAVSLNQEGEKESKIDSFSKKEKAAHAALIEAGVFDPKATQLARLEHVSAEYVKAHASMAKVEEKGTGLLIYRIEHGDPKPEVNKRTGHYFKCQCEGCQRAKYANC